MVNLLKVIRYLVFLAFIISNAIVASVAVWNLSIVEASKFFSATVTSVDIYLIVLAALGLLIIFPIIFSEILGKKVFFSRVWFELLWVGLFGLMILIGASLITSLSSRELCVPSIISNFVSSAAQVSPCPSAQVLGVFTWTPAIFLLSYFTLLFLLTLVKAREDGTVWQSDVLDISWQKTFGVIKRASMVPTLPEFRCKGPVIYAPKPRYIIPPLLDCRSARNSAYDSLPPVLPSKYEVMERPAPVSYGPSVVYQPQQQYSFYNPSVQKEMGPSRPPPAQMGQSRRQHSSPPPLGDWPRLDATSRPRSKRHNRPAPLDIPSVASPPPPRPPPRPLASASTRRTVVERSQTSIPHRTSPSRTRPPGSGHSRSTEAGSSGSHRPPPLDLSTISSHRSRSHRSRRVTNNNR